MKKALKIIRLTISIILVIPSLALAVVGLFFFYFFALFRAQKLAHSVSSFFYLILCWWIMIALGARVHIDGKENIPPKGESVIYSPNHNSMIDIPFFYCSLGRFPSMMAKKELFKVPLLHGLLISLKCIRIDRKSARSIVDSVRQGCQWVDEGHSLVVFPEGTRSKTGEVGTFKNGAFKIAERTKCRVVPVVIKNDRLLVESAHRLGFINVYIKFLPPIETKSLTIEEEKSMSALVESMVKEEWNKLPLEK